MTERVLYPSLSEDGWVNSSIKIADYMLSHFFVSDYSQSYLYHPYISSLPWIIQHTQDNITDTIMLVQSTLNVYFSRYFHNIVVEVNEVINTVNPSIGQISIYIKFTDSDNKEYIVGKLIQIADLTIKKIIDISNGT
jgi:hypothetical protein